MAVCINSSAELIWVGLSISLSHKRIKGDARFITDESITRTLSTISQSAPFIYSFTWMWSVNLRGHTNYLLLTLWELHILQFGHNMYYTNRVLQAWLFIGYNTKKSEHFSTSGLMCKNHKLLLVTDLIYCNNPKVNRKILLGFVKGIMVMLNSGLAYKNVSSLQIKILKKNKSSSWRSKSSVCLLQYLQLVFVRGSRGMTVLLRHSQSGHKNSPFSTS